MLHGLRSWQFMSEAVECWHCGVLACLMYVLGVRGWERMAGSSLLCTACHM